MLEAKNVVKTFDGFRALDGVSMTVPQGAVYGLVGPNGAGKSTIIRHFTGIYRPDSGEITLDGQPVYENPAVKGRMAAIPDDWYFFPQASIREMARLYAGTHPFLLGPVSQAAGGVPPVGKAAPAADEQGHAEAGGFLADHELHAGGAGAG